MPHATGVIIFLVAEQFNVFPYLLALLPVSGFGQQLDLRIDVVQLLGAEQQQVSTLLVQAKEADRNPASVMAKLVLRTRYPRDSGVALRMQSDPLHCRRRHLPMDK